MLRLGLKAEFRYFLLFLSAIGVIGFLTGMFLPAITLGLAAYIAWLYVHIQRLEKWVAAARKRNIPNQFDGVWGEIANDVTLLRKRYEKDKSRLQTVISRAQEMATALNDGIILINKHDNIDWWNQAAEDIVGFRRVDRGHKLTNIIRQPKFVRYFEKQHYQEPLDMPAMRSPEQYLQFHIRPFGQGERLVVIRDISRVQKLEVMRKDFVANVSHELRTPLTVIRGYIETLVDHPSLSDVVARAFKQMLEQSTRMNGLVDDLITLTKLETDDPELHQEKVVLDTLIKAIISDAVALSGANNHRFIYKSCALALRGNERELHSAISNLVFNAVKYTEPNSTITISCNNTLSDFIIQIKDQGPGIDPKHLPRLTERFYRIDTGRTSTEGGTGLGLAIVKHVMLRHDGELKIASTPKTGSTFSCQFPKQRLVQQLQAS